MIAWFARHQTAANLLMAAIMLLGLVALPGLQRETLPEIKSVNISIIVVNFFINPPQLIVKYFGSFVHHPFVEFYKEPIIKNILCSIINII